MSADRWARVRPLFFELAELEPAERAARLEVLSQGDPELQAELGRLLAAHDRSQELLGSFEDLISQPSFDPQSPSESDERRLVSDPHGLVGRTVSHYEVEEVLGGGGMGVLYKASDTRLGRTVALKFLPPQWSLDSSFKQRFEREARAAAALDHPNVCAIYEIGETGEGQLFIAMAYYHGETVKEKIARGPLEVDKAMDLAEQAAAGLAAAHRAGLVHRDIKPANLMVTEDGVVKILDFGLAKTEETALTERGARLGTPAYMSPEQTRGEEVDARTDLWSLGVVLYEMLTGQRPFRGGADSAVIDAIRRQEPQPPGELRARLPPQVEQLVLRLLSKDSEDRHEGAELLSQELAASSAVQRSRGFVPYVAAVVGVAAIMATVWVVTRADTPEDGIDPTTLDPSVVTVLPFRTSGVTPSLAFLGEGMVDLLGTKLTGAGGPRAADARAVLSRWVRQNELFEEVGPEATFQIARTLNSGLLLTGSVIGNENLLVLTAVIQDVASGEIRSRASVEGKADRLMGMVDGLVVDLLAQEAGEPERRLADLTTRSLPALQNYLEGLAAHRRGRIEEALSMFVRAVEIDSTFALAALGAHLASTWIHARPPFDPLRLAWQHREQLSERDRSFLLAETGPKYPARSSGADMLAVREALVREQPDNPEAWFALGDLLVHFGAYQDIPDSTAARRARAAFERTVALDSTYLPALEHLMIVANAWGDTASARRYAELYLSHERSGFQAEVIRNLLDLRSRGLEALPEVVARLDPTEGEVSFNTLMSIHMGTHYANAKLLQSKDAMVDAMAGQLPDPATSPWVGRLLYGLALDRGRPEEAARLLDAYAPTAQLMDSLAVTITHVRDGLHYDGSREAAARSARVLETRLPELRVPNDLPPERWAQAACVLGQWRLAQGDVEGVTPIIDGLAEIGGDGAAFQETIAFACTRLLDAWRAVELNLPDAGIRTARLDSLLGTGYPGAGRSMHEANLITARLLERLGDLPGALRVLGRYPRFATQVSYRPTFLRERGRVAMLLGDTAAAVEAYRRFLAARTDPEPSLMPMTDTIRTRLERLTHSDPASTAQNGGG